MGFGQIARTFFALAGFASVAAAQTLEIRPDDPAPEDEGIVVREKKAEDAKDGRATTRTTRSQLDERQARSAPEALRYTPGVYVQQTAHGQASPYIRGQTGRRTLLLFDGLRINHALFREGPNQYFVTVDARTIDSVEVVRGAAGVELGADAIAGAVLVHPLEPDVDPDRQGLHVQPKAAFRHATADGEVGGRLQLDAQLGRATGLLVGAGYRDVERLEAAGPIHGLKTPAEVGLPAAEKQVPRFADDGRTQLGTGFRELTGDARLVHRLGPGETLTAALYLYRQYDAPRTDQCPPPEAPETHCLTYDEQFRTHAYAKAALQPGAAAMRRLELAAAYQRQHQRASNSHEPFVNGRRDDIDQYEVLARGATGWFGLGPNLGIEGRYGVDGTFETIESAAWDIWHRTHDSLLNLRPRGQYVDGSEYAQGGVWAAPRLHVGDGLLLRAGARWAFAAADSPAVPDAETVAVDEGWSAFVANGGVEWNAWGPLTLMLNAEQGFRPPNLDDLTARQATGQGYQVENPDLDPERALTLEVGARLDWRWLTLEGWAFRSTLDDAMERRAAECPPSDRECRSNRRIAVRLVNLGDTAVIQGFEGEARVRPGLGFEGRATVSYAHGEGEAPTGGRQPLSRIPPLNGTAEARWSGAGGLYLGAATRWAAEQARLSFGDIHDARIPFGGTPGYVVHELRAGIVRPGFTLNLVLDNLTDEAYRVHGSAVNGAGRGLVVNVEVAP